MAILKQKVKELTIPVVFTRESSDSHNRKTYVYLSKMVHIRVWDETPFKDMSLSLMVGHGQLFEAENGSLHYARVLKVIWHNNKNSVQEIEDFHFRDFEGLTVTVDEDEKLLTEKEAVELVKSGTVKFLDENLAKRTIYV